ncbi:RNA polymerase sigma factor [Actinoplanes philippinensis]|uniref:RNA polymerase sigma-70 factor, ECF subfamily n=1 Tax=Actinoplanes philippinensis TaxID=35752 RepID=A0A1I2MBF8_9ACTN|nr:sigma-70 family RNA polymerase sigma factor [Actinoplanes philippinensis]GIE76369.1 RNA polymerase sigma factor [Actinoplanes philippinensis]SFF88844.1 RNA polymerase sigma-70 factor, ECF subfamily [Actinoplanes philippinensis]
MTDPLPSPSTDVLAPLVDEAVRGSSQAITAIVRATQRDLMRFLGSLAPAAEVEDLAQETYIRMVGALPGFAGRSTVRTWLFAIARRVAADHARYTSRRPLPAALPDWQTTADAAAGPHGPRFEEQQALTDLVHGLSPERRDAFVLTQIAGLSYAEVAEILGCPIGTVRSRVARARDDLITAMNDGRPGRATAG